MAGLFSVETEIDTAKAMDPCLHAGPSPHFVLDFTNRPDARRMKQTGHAKEQRVENLGRRRDPRQPAEAPDDEPKNQVSLASTGARSAMDGPFNTLPSASKRDP